MGKSMSNLHFKAMALKLQLRDFLTPPEKTLREAGTKPGFHVIDYGCGPGGYSLAAAELVGAKGRIYALDIHPLAVERVQRIATERGLANIATVLSDCATGLGDNSVDVVILYGTFHGVGNRARLLRELHRVWKPDGVLSFSDHHMKEDAIRRAGTSGGLFRLLKKNKRTYSFVKVVHK